ncbi:MAG: hypothetical protein NVV59_08290 [Chitinophagaceae bacterium]|nr:hypothetical protein [Chitinophagaceae bacterium]
MKEVTDSVPIYTDMGKLKAKIKELETLSVSRIVVHNINRKHEEFIKDFQRET